MNRIPSLISAGMLLTAMGGGAATPARAQLVTISPAELIQMTLELKQMAQEYQVLQQSYLQLQSAVGSLQHLNPRSMLTGQALMNDAMRLPGSAATAMPGLNFGQRLSGAGQQPYNQNHYYTPQGNDFAAQEMQRKQVATANIQGEAQTGMNRIAQRLAALTQLENSIPSQPDVTAVSAMSARIGAEKMYLANEGNNIQHLQLLQQTQEHVAQQRAEQHGRQQAEQAVQAWGN